MSKSHSARTLLRGAAARVARSLVRRAQHDLLSRRSFTETLEPRQLLSSSLITGADHAAVGSPYTVNLNALAQSNGSQWAIDWGDGSSVQNVATGQATATHTYAGASATRTITAGLTNGLANPLDRSFGNLGGGKTVVSTPGIDDKGFDVAVQPDGKLLVAGSTGLTVARFNADGTVDNTFGTNGRATAAGGVGTGYGLVLQSDGKILVGGGENFSLARFNADGTPDATFGTSGVVSSGFGSSYAGYDIAVVSGGKIVEVGTNGGNNFIAARFNANGSLDTTFGSGGKATLDFFGSLDKAFALAVQPDGKLLLGGQARDGTTNYQWALARYNANGTLDTTFGTNGKVTTELGHTDDAIWDLQLQSDGKIVAAGRGGVSSSTGYDFAAARYTTGGVLDTTFGTNGMTKVDFGYGGDQAYALEVLPGDKLLLAGRAQSSSNAMNFGLVRLNANGSVDTTFGTAGKVSTDFAGSTDEEEATALLPDGAVVLAGGRSTVNANGEMDFALAKYHLETSATLAVNVDDGSLTRARGVDVSHDQGTINWASVAASGESFAYVKATEGLAVVDASLAANVSGATAAGLLVGVYHRATPSTAAGDAVNEANYFVGQASAYIGNGFLRPFVDLSTGTALGTTALSAWVNTFVQTVKDATGVEPLIYTNDDIATTYLDATVTTHDLWIAQWSTAYGDPTSNTASPPSGVWGANGRTWDYWQYSQTGSVSGISGAVDLDVFPGDVASLQAVMGTAPKLLNITLTLAAANSTVAKGANYSVTFTASGPDASTLSTWTIDWGDGTVETYPTSQLAATHQFQNGGTDYTVSATAGDQTTNSLTATVTSKIPAIVLSGSDSVDEGGTYALQLSVADLSALDTSDPSLALAVDWGDGTSDDVAISDLIAAVGTLSLSHTFGAGASDAEVQGVLTGAIQQYTSDPLIVAVTPHAPTDLLATADDDGTIDLSWNDNSNAEVGYAVERSSDGTNWELVESLPADAYTVLADVDEGSSLSYRVRALGASADSANSNTIIAFAEVAAASQLTSLASTTTSIDLSWQDNSTHETGFRVEQQAADGTWGTVVGLGSDVTSTTVSGLTPDTAYTFRVVAFGASGDAGSPPQIDVRTSLVDPIPDAPTLLTATVISSGQVDLNWVDNPSDETGYRVERRDAEGQDWVSVADFTGVGYTSFSDLTTATDTTYYYRVVATGVSGASDPSNEASATTSLAAPTSLVAQSAADGGIELDWTDNAPNETQFNVYETDDGGVTSTLVLSVASLPGTGSDSQEITDLTGNTTYTYFMTAATDDLESGRTNLATATSLPKSVDVDPDQSATYDQTFTLTVTPTNIAEPATWDVNWGDSQEDQNAVPFDNGDGTFSFSHVYASPEDYAAQEYTARVTASTGDVSISSDPVTVHATSGYSAFAVLSPAEQTAVTASILQSFQTIYNTIKFQLYGGAKKSADATLATEAGNDWDQDALLKKQIEDDVGYTKNSDNSAVASFDTSFIKVDRSVVEDWLGFDAPTNANQENYTRDAVLDLLRAKELQEGVKPTDANGPVFYSNTNQYGFLFTRLHVHVSTLGLTTDLAPAWKFLNRSKGISSIGTSVSFNSSQYSPNEATSPTDWYGDQISSYMRTHTTSGQPDYVGVDSLADIGRDGPIKAKLFKNIPAATEVPHGWSSVSTPIQSDTPDDFQERLKLSIGSGSTTINVADVGAKPITVRYVANGSNYDVYLDIGKYGAATTPFATIAKGNSPVDFHITRLLPGDDTAVANSDAYRVTPGTPFALLISADQVTAKDVAAQWSALTNRAVYYATHPTDRENNLQGDYESTMLGLTALDYAYRTSSDNQRLRNYLGVIEDSSIGTGIVYGLRDPTIQTNSSLLNPYTFFDGENNGISIDLQGLPNTAYYLDTSDASNIVVRRSAVSAFGETNDTTRLTNYVKSRQADESWLGSGSLEDITNEESASTTFADALAQAHARQVYTITRSHGATTVNGQPFTTSSLSDTPAYVKNAIDDALDRFTDIYPDVINTVTVPNDSFYSYSGGFVGGDLTVDSSYGGHSFDHQSYVISDRNLSANGFDGKSSTYSLDTAVVEDPNPVSYAAERPQPDTQDNNGTTGSVTGDPVNLVSGSLYHDEVDFNRPLPGLDFSFARHYESAMTDDQGLGVGWSYSYSDTLSISGSNDETVTWTTSKGVKLVFTLTSSTAQAYLNPAGVFGSLTRSPSVNGSRQFKYVGTDGLTYTFEAGTGQGTRGLLSVDDANGNRLTIQRNGLNKTYSYQPKGETGQRVLLRWTVTNKGSTRTVVVDDQEHRTFTYTLKQVTIKNVPQYQLQNYRSPNTVVGSSNHDETHYNYWPVALKEGLLENATRYSIDTFKDVKAMVVRSESSYDYYSNGRAFSISELDIGASSPIPLATDFFTYNQYTSPTFESLYPAYIRAASHVSPSGNVDQYGYNLNGLLSRAVHADGSEILTGWQPYSTRSPVDPSANLYFEVYTYDEVGLATTDVYNESNGLIATHREGIYYFTGDNTKAKGGTETHTEYTTVGSEILPKTVTVNGVRATTYTYDGKGNVSTVRDAAGDITSYEDYTSFGAYQKKVLPKGMKETTASGRARYTVYLTYDPLTGQVHQQTQDLIRGNAAQNVVTMTYDQWGNLQASTKGESHSEPHEAAIVTSYTWDALGHELTEQVAPGTAYATLTTNVYFDDLLRQKIVKVSAAVNQETDYGYDSAGRVISTTNAVDKSHTSTGYDFDGNLTSSTDADNRTTSSFFDARDRTSETIAPDGAFEFVKLNGIGRTVSTESLPTLKTTSVYDDDPTIEATKSYDRNGFLAKETDASGQYTSYTYNALGSGLVFAEVTGTAFYDPAWSTTTPWRSSYAAFDVLGRVVETRSNSGVATRTDYDADGNAYRVTQYNVDTTNNNFMNPKLLDLTRMKLKDRRATYTTYDLGDRPIAVTDPAGDTTRTFYDVSGQVVDVLDPRAIGVTPIVNGVPTIDVEATASQLSQGGKYETSYQYDPVGRLTTTFLPAVGSQTEQTRNDAIQSYLANGAPSQSTDVGGNTVTTTYDYKYDTVTTTSVVKTDTRVQDSSAVKDVTHTSFQRSDHAGQVLWIAQWLTATNGTQYAGSQTDYAYDLAGHVIKTTDYNATNTATGSPDASATVSVIDSTYDLAGNMLTQTDERRGEITTNSYDSLGRVIDTESGTVSSGGTLLIVLRHTSNVYRHGDLVRVATYRDAGDKYTTDYDYDGADRQIAQRTASQANVVPIGASSSLSSSVANDYVWSKTYDALGQLTVSDAFSSHGSGSWTNQIQTRYEYDAAGRLKDAYGADPDDQNGTTGVSGTRTEYTYDPAGNQIDTRVYSDDRHSYVMTEDAYDGRSRVISSAQTNQSGTALQPNSASTRYTYDVYGNPRSVTDPDGNEVDYIYDSAGRVLSETKTVYMNSATAFQNVKVQKDYTYDQLESTSGMTQDEVSTVEDFHQVNSETNRKTGYAGTKITSDVDGVGRLVQERWYAASGGTPSQTIEYGYDTASRLAWEDSTYTGSSDAAHDFERKYDAMDQLTQERQQTTNTSTAWFTLTYSNYDWEGNVHNLAITNGTKLSGPNGNTNYTYDYNSLNQLSDVRMFDSSSANTGGERVAISRYQDGSLMTTSPFSGVTTSSDGNAVNAAKMTYSRDFAGRIQAISTKNLAYRYAYTYDRQGRVTSFKVDGDTNHQKNYSYFADDELNQVTIQGSATTYAYDNNQNRKDDGRASQASAGNVEAADKNWSYSYDERGNEIKKVATGTGTSVGRWEYAYDIRDRMISAIHYSTASGSTKLAEAHYTYDALDRRTEEKVTTYTGSTSTLKDERYALDGVNATVVTDGSGNFEGRYMFGTGPDQVFAEQVPGSNGFRWLLTDAEGTVRRALKIDGSKLLELDYDAFGAMTAKESGITLPRYEFTGQQYDSDTQLGYFDARYYDSSAGRFISVDPAGAGSNLYAYASNNPTNVTDPTGMDGEEFDGGDGDVGFGGEDGGAGEIGYESSDGGESGVDEALNEAEEQAAQLQAETAALDQLWTDESASLAQASHEVPQEPAFPNPFDTIHPIANPIGFDLSVPEQAPTAMSRFVSGDAYENLKQNPQNFEQYRGQLSQGQVEQLTTLAEQRASSFWPNQFNDAVDSLTVYGQQLAEQKTIEAGGVTYTAGIGQVSSADRLGNRLSGSIRLVTSSFAAIGSSPSLIGTIYFADQAQAGLLSLIDGEAHDSFGSQILGGGGLGLAYDVGGGFLVGNTSAATTSLSALSGERNLLAVERAAGETAAGSITFTTPRGDPNFYSNIALRADVDPNGVLDVVAHGNAWALGINGELVGAEEVGAMIRESPQFVGQDIRLLSCDTGSSPNGFAQQLANELGVNVHAPNDLIWAGGDGSISIGPGTYSGGRLIPSYPHTGSFVGFSPNP